MILVGLPVLLLFFLSLGGFLVSETVKGAYSKRYIKHTGESYLYTALVSIVGAGCIAALSGLDFSFSPFSVLLGLLFGVALMGHLCASSLAVRVGPFSYTSVMVALAIVIPAFSGAIFWDETLVFTDYIGLVFMAVCLVLSVQKEEGEKKTNLKWLCFSLLAMLCMASIGLLQKTHQSSLHKGEITVFLMTAFLFSGIVSFLLYLFTRRKSEQGTAKAHRACGAAALLLPIGAGLGTACNHIINLYLSGAMDSVVFFPVMCGCELLGLTLSSLLLFKERPSARQWLGLASGGVAVLLLCI